MTLFQTPRGKHTNTRSGRQVGHGINRIPCQLVVRMHDHVSKGRRSGEDRFLELIFGCSSRSKTVNWEKSASHQSGLNGGQIRVRAVKPFKRPNASIIATYDARVSSVRSPSTDKWIFAEPLFARANLCLHRRQITGLLGFDSRDEVFCCSSLVEISLLVSVVPAFDPARSELLVTGTTMSGVSVLSFDVPMVFSSRSLSASPSSSEQSESENAE